MEKDIIKDFSFAMLKKIELRHNRYTPMGWKTLPLGRLVTLLENEIDELKDAIAGGDMKSIKDESVDVSNYAMFIYEISKIKPSKR